MFDRMKPIALGAVMALASSGAMAGGAVIANANSGVDSAKADAIADVYLGKSDSLAGQEVAVIDHKEGSDIRGDFADKVLGRTESQLSSFWSKQVFTGKGEPPDKAASAEVVEFVQSTDNGVGYTTSGDIPDGVNVIHEF